MDPNRPIPIEVNQNTLPPPPPPPLAAPPSTRTPAKGVTILPVAPGYDLTSVRCSVETRLRDVIQKDEDLMCRLKEVSKEHEEGRVRLRVGLMTDGYRVDEAITPKLFHLGRLLTQVLRLVEPLDLFVWAHHEHNAFCVPSRKGNRLVMCLHSGLVTALGSQELLFVMGHEVGHALLRHSETLSIGFDDPRFSPLEIVRLRGLERAQEISCDRFGLLACQDVRVASSALFKIASGLTEKWIAFDETAYSRHFDELSSMAEVMDLEDAARTHPLVPLRVKALIAFAKSEPYAKAFGRTGWSIPATELDRGVETMLSVLSPDLSELETAQEQDAVGQFLIDGALLVIAADGVVNPEEVAWLNRLTEKQHSGEKLAADLASGEFRQQLNERLEQSAHVLRNKLPEQKRAGLLHAMCEVALSAGGIPKAEFEVLNELRRMLRIRGEIAEDVLRQAREEQDEGNGEPSTATGQTEADSASDPLAAILERANLPQAAHAEAEAMCNKLRSSQYSAATVVRALVSWAISASRRRGPLNVSQGKKLAISALKVARDIEAAESGRSRRPSPIDKQIREFGLVAMFQRGEKVTRPDSDKAYVVVSISRTRGRLTIAPVDDLDAVEYAEPHELYKDPVNGIWPAELAD